MFAFQFIHLFTIIAFVLASLKTMDHVQYFMQQGTLRQLMAHINPHKCPNSKINEAMGDTIDAKAALEHLTAGKLNNTRGHV